MFRAFVYASSMDARDGSERVPVVKEVTLRLARPEARLLWDAQIGLHHPLGFKQGAGCASSRNAKANSRRCCAGERVRRAATTSF